MKITFLGTGTSTGVPTIGCRCDVCRSADPKDKRLRCSALVETDSTRILIDAGPDCRQQLLTQPFRRIDAVLITHIHYDHVAGLDDLRPFCRFGSISIYADRFTSRALRHTVPYFFAENRYPGVPKVLLSTIYPHKELRIGDIDVLPFVVMHDKMPILAFRFVRITPNEPTTLPFAYITDMKSIDASEMTYLKNVDTLVCNALRFTKPHHSHMLVDEAVVFARRVGARRTLLIHSCHDIGLHKEVNAILPEGFELAFDGQSIEVK